MGVLDDYYYQLSQKANTAKVSNDAGVGTKSIADLVASQQGTQQPIPMIYKGGTSLVGDGTVEPTTVKDTIVKPPLTGDELYKSIFGEAEKNIRDKQLNGTGDGTLTGDALKTFLESSGGVPDGFNTATGKYDTPVVNPPAVATTTSSTGGYKGATDNSALIRSEYDNILSALKAKIQQSMNDKNLTISQLGDKYQPERNTSEVNRYADLKSVLEQSANAGDRGGIGRENALLTQTSADNRMNAISLQQAQEEASLKNDIANLIAEGNYQEATIKSNELKDLIANNQYVDSTDYARYRDSVADTGKTANGSDTLAGLIAKSNIKNTEASTTATEIANKEASNPNSVTNQLKTIGLDTAKLNYSTLEKTQQAQVDTILADLKSKNIDNDTATYKLKEISDPNSVTNQLARVTLNDAKKTLEQKTAEFSEWQRFAPMRLKSAQEQVLSATSASQLARLQVQNEQETILANKIKTANLTREQLDAHNLALQQIANSKDDILNRAKQLGIQNSQLQIERDKLSWDKSTDNPANIKVNNTALQPYNDYIKNFIGQDAIDPNSWTKVGQTVDGVKVAGYIYSTGLDGASKSTLASQWGLPSTPDGFQAYLNSHAEELKKLGFIK